MARFFLILGLVVTLFVIVPLQLLVSYEVLKSIDFDLTKIPSDFILYQFVFSILNGMVLILCIIGAAVIKRLNKLVSLASATQTAAYARMLDATSLSPAPLSDPMLSAHSPPSAPTSSSHTVQPGAPAPEFRALVTPLPQASSETAPVIGERTSGPAPESLSPFDLYLQKRLGKRGPPADADNTAGSV